MRKLLAWNVVEGGPAGFDCETQQLVDEDDSVLRGNHAAVIVATDADPEAVAAALAVIVMDIREAGLEALYATADRKAA